MPENDKEQVQVQGAATDQKPVQEMNAPPSTFAAIQPASVETEEAGKADSKIPKASGWKDQLNDFNKKNIKDEAKKAEGQSHATATSQLHATLAASRKAGQGIGEAMEPKLRKVAEKVSEKKKIITDPINKGLASMGNVVKDTLKNTANSMASSIKSRFSSLLAPAKNTPSPKEAENSIVKEVKTSSAMKSTESGSVEKDAQKVAESASTDGNKSSHTLGS